VTTATSTAISALAVVNAAPDAGVPARPEDLTEAPGNSEEELVSADDPGLAPDAVLDSGEEDEAEDVADLIAEEEDAAEADGSVVLLPDVEESDLGVVDTLDQLSAEQLATQGDLWERLRKGFQMDTSVDNERISIQRNWYLRNNDYLERVARRATRYLHYTVSVAEQRNLPTELALLPVIESAYDPFAYSHADAAGMWQFIPGTARIMGLKQNEWFDGRRDIIESTRAAYDFLSLLYGKFGDWQLALAAYNAGPGAVQRAINRNAAAGLPTDFWSLRLPAETQSYVPRFLAIAQIIKSPESFGVALRPVLNQPFFRVVETKGQVDLPQAASIAGISLKELFQLNAGFKRQASDPSGPHRLLVPAALPQDFESDITALPVPEFVLAQSYKVRKGDTLYAVARRFSMQPAELKRLNNLSSDKLAAGRTLTIARANVSAEFLKLSQEMRLDRGSQASNRKVVSRVYKVRRGDTLATIARRHGMTVKSLARLNGISAKTKVRAGQKLAVRKAVAKAGKQRVASAGKGSKAGMRKIRYEVRRGDTLASIGKRYKVSVRQIKRWNGSGAKLRPGQDLVLYVAGPNRRNM
jgi:membrane-bound lytic murein transglycosylase D